MQILHIILEIQHWSGDSVVVKRSDAALAQPRDPNPQTAPTFGQSSMMNISRFPRIRLGHLPTPLEPMPNLSKKLGGPRLWIKRDDCTGLSSGGNKTRKLEFLMGDAVAKGADTIITQGA